MGVARIDAKEFSMVESHANGRKRPRTRRVGAQRRPELPTTRSGHLPRHGPVV